jgi:OmpA-OmpF porin, OOP family
MKAKIFAILIGAIPLFSHAQFGGLLNKAKDKVNYKVSSKIDRKIDQEIDSSLAKLEGKKSSTASQTNNQETTANNPTNAKSGKAYLKYDFVPGEKIIYSNDFSQEAMGELPIGWNSSGNGAVAKVDGYPNNWVQLFQNSVYLTDNKDSLTQNFTVEFDLLMRRSDPKQGFAQLGFGVLSSGDESTTSNAVLQNYKKTFAAELKIQPVDGAGSHMHLETFLNDARDLRTDVKQYPALSNYFNQPIHIAIQVQKQRLRLWLNENKLYDLPKAIAEGVIINQLFFFVKNNNVNDQEVAYDISNIKIAKGVPDTRHKLLDEGKFSTTGILFDVNAATIKPESNGVLREVAEALKSSPDFKVKIIGHTDADGSDAANLALSAKRAAAVKDTLVNDFGIDASRLTSEGLGETKPVADNKTKEGKAQNRRVEFIKQ